jgi:hypothetical protein
MNDFVYVLSYNPFGDNPNASQVEVFIQKHREIDTWYYPFLGTYIFKSSKLLADLAPGFRQFFGNSPCMLTYASPSLIGGSLPQAVWDWINASAVPSLSDGN